MPFWVTRHSNPESVHTCGRDLGRLRYRKYIAPSLSQPWISLLCSFRGSSRGPRSRSHRDTILPGAVEGDHVVVTWWVVMWWVMGATNDDLRLRLSAQAIQNFKSIGPNKCPSTSTINIDRRNESFVSSITWRNWPILSMRTLCAELYLWAEVYHVTTPSQSRLCLACSAHAHWNTPPSNLKSTRCYIRFTGPIAEMVDVRYISDDTIRINQMRYLAQSKHMIDKATVGQIIWNKISSGTCDQRDISVPVLQHSSHLSRFLACF